MEYYISYNYTFHLCTTCVCPYQVACGGDSTLEIKAHSYDNHGGRCAKLGGTCCESQRDGDCDPDRIPDPYFVFCLGLVEQTVSHPSQCTLGVNMSHSKEDDISFTFDLGSTALLAWLAQSFAF